MEQVHHHSVGIRGSLMHVEYQTKLLEVIFCCFFFTLSILMFYISFSSVCVCVCACVCVCVCVCTSCHILSFLGNAMCILWTYGTYLCCCLSVALSYCKLVFSGMSVGTDRLIGYFCVVSRYNWKRGVGSPVACSAISWPCCSCTCMNNDSYGMSSDVYVK
jgi:hypothetical protein